MLLIYYVIIQKTMPPQKSEVDITLRLSFARSSRSQIFFKIGVIKNFINFTGKHLCWSLFLIKFKQTATQIFSSGIS